MLFLKYKLLCEIYSVTKVAILWLAEDTFLTKMLAEVGREFNVKHSHTAFNVIPFGFYRDFSRLFSGGQHNLDLTGVCVVSFPLTSLLFSFCSQENKWTTKHISELEMICKLKVELFVTIVWA